jgi:hypothetical protein
MPPSFTPKGVGVRVSYRPRLFGIGQFLNATRMLLPRENLVYFLQLRETRFSSLSTIASYRMWCH